jgi:Uma2 family endonuclease
MAMPVKAPERLWTAEDLLALGEEARYELIEGRLVPMSPTGLSHGYTEARIVALLWSYLREHPIGILVTGEVGFVLRRDPDTVRAADIAFIRADRLPPEGLPFGFFEGAPDLAVEILSPFDRYPDLLRKVSQWLEAGTRLVWVVDPARRTVTAFQFDGTLRLLDESAELDGVDVLPGFRHPVRDLFEGEL